MRDPLAVRSSGLSLWEGGITAGVVEARLAALRAAASPAAPRRARRGGDRAGGARDGGAVLAPRFVTERRALFGRRAGDQRGDVLLAVGGYVELRAFAGEPGRRARREARAVGRPNIEQVVGVHQRGDRAP